MTIRDMVSSTILSPTFCTGDNCPRSMSSQNLSTMHPLDSRGSLTNFGCVGNSLKYYLTPTSLWCRFCRRKTGDRSLPRVLGTARGLFAEAPFHSRFWNIFLLLFEIESILFRIPIMLGWVTKKVSCSKADRTLCERSGSVFGTCKVAILLSW